MKTIINLFLLLFTFSLISLIPDEVKLIGHLKKIDGGTIEIYKSFYVDEYGKVLYNDKTGKEQKVKQDDVAWIDADGNIYIRQITNKKKNDSQLYELVARNTKYKLYWLHYSSKELGWQAVVLIYDNDDNKMERMSWNEGDYRAKKKTEVVDKIEEYFKDCPDLMSELRKTVNDKKAGLFDHLHKYVSCTDAPAKETFLK